MQEVIVVLQPVGQHVVRDHAPAPFPHLQHAKPCWWPPERRASPKAHVYSPWEPKIAGGTSPAGAENAP